MGDPRRTRAWRELRDRVVREEPICWLRLPGICTYWSTTGDHVEPVGKRPDLALVRSNVHGACLECNNKRGDLPISALVRGGNRPDALGIFD